MADLPTLLFVPGAWHLPSCYDKIISLLQKKHELRCISITLPTTIGDPAKTFKDDVDAAQDAIRGETTQGRNVVVIAHSYGGMVGNSAIKGFASPKDGAPSQGRVIGVILIASGFTLAGLTFMDLFLGKPPPAFGFKGMPPSWRINKTTGFAELLVNTREFFYHDVPAEEAEYWVSQLQPQSLRALFEGREYAYAGWRDVPAWYIGTIEDMGLPVLAQRMTVGMARSMGATVGHTELQTSHSPFLSEPEATTKLVVEAVESFTGKVIDTGREQSGQVSKAIAALPVPRFLQPSTWFKYGLPLLFGHMMGKVVLIVSGVSRLFRRAS